MKKTTIKDRFLICPYGRRHLFVNGDFSVCKCEEETKIPNWFADFNLRKRFKYPQNIPEYAIAEASEKFKDLTNCT